MFTLKKYEYWCPYCNGKWYAHVYDEHFIAPCPKCIQKLLGLDGIPNNVQSK